MLAATQDSTRALPWKRDHTVARLVGTTLLVGTAYYFGVQFAFVARPPQSTYSPIWPPIAILLAALLLTPTRHWWIWLLAAVPAHLAVYVPLGTPPLRQAIQLIHNFLIVMLPALVLRRFAPQAVQLTTFRSVLIFLATVVMAAAIIPAVSATLYLATGFADSFWLIWRLIAFSNILAYLIVLPTILLVVQHWRSWLQLLTVRRAIEGAILGLLVLLVGEFVFGLLPASNLSDIIVRTATLPLLLWAAVRFGTGGVSLALMALTLEALLSAAIGAGPFTAAAPTQNVLNLPSYFLTFAAPMLLLAALMADRRESAAALARINAELEYRVAERTAQLEQSNTQLAVAKDRAESASRAKSAFLATISHELRTPLHTILGYNRQLMSNPTLLPAQLNDALIVHHSAEHLLSLINSVLDLSRLEADQTRLSPTSVNLPQLLHELIGMFRLQATGKKLYMRLDVAPDVPQYIAVDAVKLRQVLINLLGNAVKFTESGGITFATRCEWNDKPSMVTLVFEVADTGPGLTPEEHEHMFDPFVQTRAGQRLGEGSGLGLAISRQFVGLMGGVLNVQSTYGQGTIFTVRVPVEITNQADLPNPELPRLLPMSKPSRILVVDDHREHRALMKALLSSFGMDVREASNGDEALAIEEAWHPQLIFLDLRLPRLNGQAVAKRIRETAQEPPVVIALSASGFAADDSLFLAEGFDDFVHKPFQAADICAVLHRHLGLNPFGADTGNSQSFEPSKRLRRSGLASLPDDQLAMLERVAREGNPQQIAAVIAEIRAHNQALGEALQGLADEVAFDVILEAVRDTRGDSRPINVLYS